ncbi:MAG: hypothetical protein M3Z24_06185 [Chloroflexota bacterium]|nr:hypothetical protein [Chloroflexota bacterium]
MLEKLIVSAISKAKMLEFLGLSAKTAATKQQLVEKLLVLLETDMNENARLLEAFRYELAVGPLELETLLECTKAERKRWIQEGKIPVLEYRTFRKVGREMNYPVHDRLIIRAISQEDIRQWRTTYQENVQSHRKAGAQVALESKKVRSQWRQDFLLCWGDIVKRWREQGSPEIAAAFQLAFWTGWASRWAKENQIKSLRGTKHKSTYRAQRDAWYTRKNEAMGLLFHTPYARLSFYRPEDADKLSLYLCDEHYEMKCEGMYEDKWDFFVAHTKEVKACPKCSFNQEKDYYSLYYLEITASTFPDIHFSFHMPYPLGKSIFPAPAKLPKVEHIEQDGLFRFGRTLLTQEKIIYREKDVLSHFEQALTEMQRSMLADEIKH